MSEITAVNRSARLAVTDTGEVCEITNMFDRDGDETERSDEAVSAVAALPSGQWAAIDLTQFDPVEVN
jgi:hypothetical protein